MREKHRLRVLQVREAGHDRARMGVGLRDQRPLKMAESAIRESTSLRR
ncbi:MAG: hypothetical protein V8T86_05030 [Victivallis sp.]